MTPQQMPPSSICHIQIRTHNCRQAHRFYSSVFDWHFNTTMPGSIMIDTGNAPTGELIQVPSDEIQLGICSHIRVKDCAKLARNATQMGGQLIFPKLEDPEINWFADTLDPWGNELAFWQPMNDEHPLFIGSGENDFHWVEMPVANIHRAMLYYSKLLGWNFNTPPGATSMAHTTPGGKELMGISILENDWIPENEGSLVYIRVNDLENTLAKILRASGRILLGIEHTPSYGSRAVFADPEGNKIGLFQALYHEPKPTHHLEHDRCTTY